MIKYEICSEEDLVGTNERLKELKSILKGKINNFWIKNRYGDANKPFSELWIEEEFSSIHAKGLQGNKNMCCIKKIMIRSLTQMQRLFELRLVILTK